MEITFPSSLRHDLLFMLYQSRKLIEIRLALFRKLAPISRETQVQESYGNVKIKMMKIRLTEC